MRLALNTFSLDRCVELARFLLAMTAGATAFYDGGYNAVGGPWSVVTITATDGVRWIERKERKESSKPADPVWLSKAHAADLPSIVVPTDIQRPATYTVASAVGA